MQSNVCSGIRPFSRSRRATWSRENVPVGMRFHSVERDFLVAGQFWLKRVLAGEAPLDPGHPERSEEGNPRLPSSNDDDSDVWELEGSFTGQRGKLSGCQ